MNIFFKSSTIFKRRDVDSYIFFICNSRKDELDKIIETICKLLNIKSIPKKLFDKNQENEFERILYTDKHKVYFYSIGKINKCNNNSLYINFGKIGKQMSTIPGKKIVYLIGTKNNVIKNCVASYILGSYQFNYFKTNKKNINTETYFYHHKRIYKPIIDMAIYEATIQNELRNLINTPSNILNSKNYLYYIKNNLPENVTLKVLNKKDLKQIGCNLIVGVNEGSSNEPYLLILEYKNIEQKYKKNPKSLVLVGKGVMFDSGGYNIKLKDMHEMKNDMTGSAIVYGIFKLLSKMNVKGRFVGLLPLVENMVDSNAYRPGDIIKAYNGKTVEIINTDAEGRLIMADALSYAANFNPYLCIDIATLTGQAGTIFDNKSSVVLGNSNRHIQQIIKIGMENNEKFWELPMWNEFVNSTKSKIADYRNDAPESKASTIYAGAFLSNFIPKNVDWLHLDIAGVDMLKKDILYRYSGATGEILRTLFEFIYNINSVTSPNLQKIKITERKSNNSKNILTK